MEADISKYLACMEEIKRRTDVIHSFARGELTAKYRIIYSEILCLQIRKILELIALASITANKEEYSKQNAKFHQHWNAKRILEDLEKVNPNFYPIPGVQVKDEKTGKVVEVRSLTEGFLTKDEFVTVFDRCSQLLHADNPYGTPQNLDELEKLFPEWMEKIKKLLNHHQIQLLNQTQQLWVIMKAETDGRAHGFIFQRIDDPEKIAALKPKTI